MPLQVAYVKIPVIVNCLSREVKEKINKHFGSDIYIEQEYCDKSGVDVAICLQIIKQQTEIIKKLQEEIK